MLPTPLDQIIQAITGVVSPTSFIKDKLQRSEIVIKLLKQFNLNPEHPPSDFSGVYVYTLVEYGVGKPQPFLELFRAEEIKQAFRKAFDSNNPSTLLSEVDVFINAYAVGDEIYNLGVDIKREVAAFATLFIEVAKRSRTPSDVLISQQIGSLHERIVIIHEQLDRLSTLEGVRTEIARLASENYPALPGNLVAQENNCRAFALAQQMRGWFETLGYRLEKYEIWMQDYFEWIINIPVRRNRYDRVLVRGIAGEAGVSDVTALKRSVEQQHTDEGWLITARRVSRAARSEVEKEENNHLGCYTFDELLAQDADFAGYLDWLEAEVKQRKIDTKYIPLACIKEEIDSVTKRSIAISRYEEEDGWIDGYIDRWLDDPAKEHISILGEFGTGKTWFALHYAWLALQRYRDAQKRGVELSRLPLVIPLRDYAKAVSVESLFSEFFFRKHEIPLPGYSAFEQLNRMGKLLLIFDGFDEMAAKVDKQQMINNFWELAKVVVPGAKVILTCRTEHFPEAQEGRALLNAELQASTANLTGETPQFEVLELEKFNDEQIRSCLSYAASAQTVEQIMGSPQLLDLARRPVMTELILEALPDIEAGKPVDMSRVYLYAVQRKIERDIRSDRTFTSLADKLYFLCELSWEMLSVDVMSLNYRQFPERIRRLFGGIVQQEKDLDHWNFDMMGQTMLIRNADGDYTPAHRSLLEFFVAYKFAAELGVLADDFTQLARSQSHLSNDSPQEYTWSSYFSRNIDMSGNILASAPLSQFVSEPLEKLRETFGRLRLTKAVIDLILPMVDIDAKETIIKVIETTKGRSEDEVGYVGGNAATLALKINKTALEGKDFSGVVVKGADFTNASLRCTNFVKANLTECHFIKTLDMVCSLDFSPDNKLYATGEAGGFIRLWRVVDNKQISLCKGHTGWVRYIVFSYDSKILASGSHDKTIKLWNVQTGECLKTLIGHTEIVRSLAFSLNDNILASSSDDATIRLWNIATGECVHILQGHSSYVTSIAISPNGTILASTSLDKTIKLWNVLTGKCLKTLIDVDTISSVSFTPDGKILISGSGLYDKTIKFWDINTGNILDVLLGHKSQIRCLIVSSDGKILISGDYDGILKIWNLHSRECLQTLLAHNEMLRSLAISPDNETLISSSQDRTVKLWNIKTGKCIKTLQGHTSWVLSVTFSPDSQKIACASNDKTVKLWDVETEKCIYSLQGHTQWVNGVAISNNEKNILSSSGDSTVKIWDFSSGECLRTIEAHNGWLESLAISHDSKAFATSSHDKTVKLWDIETGDCLKVIKVNDKITSLDISLDGQILVGGGKVINFWNIQSGKCILTLEGHTDWIKKVVISGKNNILVSCSRDKTIKLWNMETGTCIKTLQGHTSYVVSVAINPNNQIIASASNDQTVRLWDMQTGECKTILHGHTNWVCSVAFSPNGSILASAGYDGTIKLWDVKSGKCLKTIDNKPYAGMNITNVTGISSANKASLQALGAVENEE